ncbi:hypothetical protein KJ359_001173 [Pestalotiopsis sp. 9143b]|nr:hypothetical protein KJ359_001173 [Pestalotiopsis sp. 9143b]
MIQRLVSRTRRLLAAFQFVTGIRHKTILYPRIAGFIAVVLAVLGNAGTTLLSDTGMGGELSMHAVVGLITVLAAVMFGLGVWNV